MPSQQTSQSAPPPSNRPATGIDAPPVIDFFDGWAPNRRSVLCLDYDGTLAPFVSDRDRAVPYPGVRERLRRLAHTPTTRLIIVSGRAVSSVRRLLDLETPVEIWGNHGVQRRRTSGTIETVELSGSVRDAVAEARQRVAELELGSRLEQKPVSVAVHIRGMSSEASKVLLERVRRRWGPIVERDPDRLEIHPFDGGLEFRSSTVDKGFPIRAILEETDRATPIAYLGDDRTDEDAFEALGDRGLRILVRDELRPTAADVWLRPPEELLELFDRWLHNEGSHEL